MHMVAVLAPFLFYTPVTHGRFAAFERVQTKRVDQIDQIDLSLIKIPIKLIFFPFVYIRQWRGWLAWFATELIICCA